MTLTRTAMTQDACSPDALGGGLPGVRPCDHLATGQPGSCRLEADQLETLLELPAMRCAETARMRGEPLAASAVRYRRFLLLEVPGPWGSSALDDCRMDADITGQLAAAASAADTHVLLIRRPGRHPSARSGAGPAALAWAITDTSPEVERVLWGTWSEPADLLGLDLDAPIPDDCAATGPQRLALVCTNGKRDQCCAVRGRPVAAAIAAATDWDTWECSHLGGHRFAATAMLLPSGDMFGWLDPESAPKILQRFDAGQIVLSNYRGRCGQPAEVQAALHIAAVRLGDYRRGAVRVASLRPLAAGADTAWPEDSADAGDHWEAVVTHRSHSSQETAYLMTMTRCRLAPTYLSCSDDKPKAETRYEATAFARIR
jgi:hypothetical protein